MDNTGTIENRKNDRWMLITLVVIALNLRGPITGVGTLVPLIKDGLGINNTVAGMITTVPLLIFLVISPLSASISRRFSIGTTLMTCFIFILVGLPLRSSFGVIGLFAGTTILSVGLGMAYVLTLSVIKLRFPNRIGSVTGTYSTAIAAAAALSIGLSVPVATGLNLGWEGALAMWIIVAATSLILWIGRVKNEPKLRIKEKNVPVDKSYSKMVYKIPLAWCFAVFNGTQTLIFYTLSAWLPSLMVSKGYSVEASAGFALFFQLSNLPVTFILPILCARRKNQTGLLLVVGSCLLGGLILLSFVHSVIAILLTLIVTAIGLGSAFGFVNTFLSLRVDNAQQSAALSGMVLTMGYLFSFLAPTIVGFIFDMTNSWTISMILLQAVALIWMITGLPLAKDRKFFPKESKS